MGESGGLCYLQQASFELSRNRRTGRVAQGVKRSPNYRSVQANQFIVFEERVKPGEKPLAAEKKTN